MNYIPMKYYVEEGKEAPEGTIVKKCSICQGTFAVPQDVAKDLPVAAVCDHESCVATYEKQVAVANMKNDGSAASDVKMAVGS